MDPVGLVTTTDIGTPLEVVAKILALETPLPSQGLATGLQFTLEVHDVVWFGELGTEGSRADCKANIKSAALSTGKNFPVDGEIEVPQPLVVPLPPPSTYESNSALSVDDIPIGPPKPMANVNTPLAAN